MTRSSRAIRIEGRVLAGQELEQPPAPTSLRGDGGRVQEFWVFRRRGEDWLVKAIERSGESDRLERDNHVGELNERQMESAQQCLAL